MDRHVEVSSTVQTALCHAEKEGSTSSSDISHANVDEILQEAVGVCGLWQFGVALLLMISSTSLMTFPVYANSASNYRCRLDSSVEKWIEEHSVPFQVIAGLTQPYSSNGCTQLKINWTEVDLMEFFNQSLPTNITDLSEPCSMGYVFEDSPYYYPGNVIKEFETVCDKAWLASFGTGLFMSGAAVGMIAVGWGGDLIGRKWTIIGCAIIEVVSGFGVTFAPNYPFYVVSRLLTGLGTFGRIVVAGILVIELTTARYRSTLKAMLVLGIACIYRGLLAIMAYFIPYWRWLHLAAISPNLFAILYFPFLPESPRWLLSQQRYADAARVLNRGFRVNHAFCRISPELRRRMDGFVDQLNECDKVKRTDTVRAKSFSIWWQSFKATFNTNQVLRTTILATVIMLGMKAVFVGLLLYARMIRYYVFIVGLLNAAIALPGSFLFYVVYRFTKQRKRPLLFLLSLAVVILLACGFYTIFGKPESEYLLIICTNVIVCVLLGVGNMAQVFISELLPTSMRTQVIGLSMGISNIGGILSTMMNELDKSTAHGLPLIIYAITLFIVCVAVAFLRDTTGENVPDN